MATNTEDAPSMGSLLDAAWSGDVEVVQHLLKSGAEVNETDETGATPLFIAALEGHVEVVQQLLKAGADVNKAQQTGVTTLSIAALNGHVEVVQQLLKAGAEVDKAEQTGATPLFIAAGNGHVEVVQQLLKAGAEVDKAEQTGATPLFIAAQYGHVEVVQQLLEAGAEVDKARQTGATPLFIAAQYGHVEVVQQLLKVGAEVDKAEQNGITPLIIAAQKGHVEVVQQLLKAGAEVDKAEQDGDTPLNIAAGNGHVEVVQQLVKAGADVDKAEQHGITPLIIAAGEGHVEVVQQLLKAGADVDKAQQTGVTPLNIAAGNGHVEVVQQLVKAGAEVNKAQQVTNNKGTCRGLTALHVTAIANHFEVAGVLLVASKGAINQQLTMEFSKDITNIEVAPLHIAAGNGNLNIVNLLVSAGADTTCAGAIPIEKKDSGELYVESPYDVAVRLSHNLVAYTLWSANNREAAQSGCEFPTEISAHRVTIQARQQTEKNIIRTLITTVLSEHVGLRWRELARDLDIRNVELDEIERRCNINLRGLREMAVESLLLWLNRQPYWPNIFDVWWALQNMQMVDVAELLLEKLTEERTLANVTDDVGDKVEANVESMEEQTEDQEGAIGASAVTVQMSFFKRFQQLFISSPVFRWMRKFKFDAFVSANQRDFPWVDEWVQQLESPPHNLKICVHHRDFRSGVPIPHNIDWAVANSRKILIVLSPNFLSSNWCKVELKAAIEKELKSDKYCVLPMLKSKCEIPDELALLTYLDCTDGNVDVAKLASDIKSKVKKRATFASSP